MATALSPASAPSVSAVRLTRLQWVICATAAIGFAVDSFVLLMAPLVLPPALVELLGVPLTSPRVNEWVGFMLYVPAVAGGIFGLLGGYLTDLFGRRNVLIGCTLLYALSALAAGFSTSVGTLLFWRSCSFVGVCVEFVAAVAWLSELFPNSKQREAVVGYTQAFGSLGGIMATGAYFLFVTYGQHLPAIGGGHEAWRYTLMSGVILAIPLIVIRPFLPESPIWREKKAAGTLKRPSPAELFQIRYRRTTLVTTVMMACAYAAAFGALQQVPRIVPGLPGVRTLARPATQQIASAVQSYQETGGLVGRLLLAFLAVRILSRRRLLRVFQIPGLVLLPLVFLFPATSSLRLLEWGIFAVGLLTIAQFSFWGNYLPRVYPTHLRGTGESFAANVGGRMIGTSAALVTTQLVPFMPGATPPTRLAYACALVGTAVYVIGFITSFWLPEPGREELPE
jgi:MFS family permease